MFNNGNCSIKTSATGPVSCRDCISGPRICKSCFKYQYDIVGNDIKSYTNVKSAVECQQKCQDLATCKYFVFKWRINTCWLKRAENPTKTSCRDCTYGPKTCQDCFLNQTDISGNDIARLTRIQSPGDCQQKCRDTPNCNYFLFKEGPLCFLKSLAAPPTYDPTAIAMGPKTCTSCFEYQYSYEGNEIEMTFPNIYDPQSCQSLCQKFYFCFFFTFSWLTNTCMLISDFSAAVFCPNCVSGTVTCR